MYNVQTSLWHIMWTLYPFPIESYHVGFDFISVSNEQSISWTANISQLTLLANKQQSASSCLTDFFMASSFPPAFNSVSVRDTQRWKWHPSAQITK